MSCLKYIGKRNLPGGNASVLHILRKMQDKRFLTDDRCRHFSFVLPAKLSNFLVSTKYSSKNLTKNNAMATSSETVADTEINADPSEAGCFPFVLNRHTHIALFQTCAEHRQPASYADFARQTVFRPKREI